MITSPPEPFTAFDIERAIGSGEASRRLRCSPLWARSLAESGELRAVRTAIGYLFDPDSIDDYLARRERRAAS